MRAPSFKGNVIISNLSNEVTSSDLAALFDDFGLVLGAKIERWHDRPGGGQGMVDLAPATSVDKAIQNLNGHMLAGSKIAVRRAPPRKKAPAKPRPAAAMRPAPRDSEFKLGDRPTLSFTGVAASRAPSQRKVVVEYRAPRRVAIPPRARSADHG